MAAMYKGKTKSQWENEITGFSFDGVWPEIMKRLYPDHLILNESTPSDSGEALYDKLRPYTQVGGDRVFATKLAYDPTVLNELADYKSERLRKIDQRFRMLELFNWKQATINAGLFLGYSNLQLIINKIIKDNMETELTLIESEDAILKSAHNDEISEYEADRAFMRGLDLSNIPPASHAQILGILSKEWIKRNR